MGVTACGEEGGGGGGGEGGGKAQGNTLTIYSSLPLQGPSRAQSTAVINGEKLALKQANNKAGKFNIKYVSKDDSTAAAGKWQPGPVSQNARQASQDKATIAYLGEFNSGASAISMPILSKAGILQISPSNTGVGLTVKEPGSEPGEPQKYYPGTRHYARVVPRDSIQGPALTQAMKSDGCKSVYILNDKEVYGAGLAKQVELAAPKQQIKVDGNEGIDIKASNYRSQAERIQSDCFFFGGIIDSNAVQVYKDVSAANPEARLYGADGVCESSTAEGLPADVAEKFQCTAPTVPPEEQPKEGQEFFEEYERTYGDKNPDPYAIYGYESMRLVLDSIEALGDKGNDRKALIDQVLKNTKDRQSVLGTYSIDQNGDTSITTEALFKIEDKEITPVRTIEAPAG